MAFVLPTVSVAQSVQGSLQSAACPSDRLGYFQASSLVGLKKSNKLSFHAASQDGKSEQNESVPQINMAVTKEKKQQVLEDLKQALSAEDVSAVFGLEFTGITHKNLEQLRKKMPEGTKVQVVKNTIMNLAIKETRWEPLADHLKGPVAFVMCKEDPQASVKAYKAFNKEVLGLKGDDDFKLNFGCFEGELLARQDMIQFDTFPTKQECMARIARALKSIPTRIARGVKSPPTKLARALQMVADGKGEKIQLEEGAASNDDLESDLWKIVEEPEDDDAALWADVADDEEEEEEEEDVQKA
mmetsp:Transcript_26486/g.45609  ORF Transcript_26486/g.45609 Transcript_26486/m.45609 type:complete len:300 (-) Transcript_26486:733-1632(-)